MQLVITHNMGGYWEGGWVRRSGISPWSKGVLVWVSPPPHKLWRVELFIMCEKCPWGVELGELFVKDLDDVSGVFGDSREIRGGILNCGRIFARTDVSQIVAVRSRTVCRCDVTINVVRELLILQRRWWGEVWNEIACLWGPLVWLTLGSRLRYWWVTDTQERHHHWPGERARPLPCSMRSGIRSDHRDGRQLGKRTDSKSVAPRLTFGGLFSRLSWAFR